MKDKKWIERAIAWAQNKGIGSIKSVHEDFEDPTSFTLKRTGDKITPDLTGLRHTQKNYIEIALKDVGDRTRKISKWRLLSTLATRQGGQFYILAPRGHKAFAERIIKEHNLNSQLVVI